MTPLTSGKALWLTLFALLWAVLGLTGRDAWQPEEVAALDAVLAWLQQGGSPWAAPAPLHAWVAGQFAAAAPMGLDAQDSARLASALFSMTALFAVAMAARAHQEAAHAPAAVLALLGGFGLMLRAHALIPEMAWLAVWALLLWALASTRAHPRAGGTALGLCVAVMTLGLRGLPDLLAALLLLALLPVSPAWRTPAYYQALARAGVAAVAVLLPVFAWLALSGWMSDWWHWHGLSRLTPVLPATDLFSELTWFAWPLWPLAVAALWHAHRRVTRAHELHMPLLACAVLLLAALPPAWSELGALLPLLLPLALLSAQAVVHLKRGAAQAFYWFGVMCFVFFGVAFWVYFAAIEWQTPVQVAAHMRKLTPNYAPGGVSQTALFTAGLASAAWLIAIPLFKRAQIRPLLVWATGMALTWVLLATLFRPWAEAGWGYRPLIADMARHLHNDHRCLTTRVDAEMLTMVRYHLGGRIAIDARPACANVLLRAESAEAPASPGYRVAWQGWRPRDKQQVYRLEVPLE